MTRFRIIELDTLRGGDTAMYPITADNPFEATQKFYVMRKPPVSSHILAIPEVNIFENCRNERRQKKLYWKTEMDSVKTESIRGLAELFIKEESSLELLLMLLDEGPKTICEISDVMCGTKDIQDTRYIKINELLVNYPALAISFGWELTRLAGIEGRGLHLRMQRKS